MCQKKKYNNHKTKKKVTSMALPVNLYNDLIHISDKHNVSMAYLTNKGLSKAVISYKTKKGDK